MVSATVELPFCFLSNILKSGDIRESIATIDVLFYGGIFMAETDQQNQRETQEAGKEGKYLTFFLNQEEYGVGILKIKEIIGMMAITAVPRTPDYVKGVINLRGKVIPIIDLRIRFGMPPQEYDERTCIIVVEIDGDDVTIPMGVVVDSVSEVCNVDASQVEETPTFGTALDTAYILGMAKMEDSVKILLDIDKVLGREELKEIEQTF